MTESVNAFKDTAKANMKVLDSYIDKIPGTGVPAIDRFYRPLQKAMGNKEMAGFDAARLTVIQEVARVLGTATANGVITEQQRHEMQKTLEEAATPEQMREAISVYMRDFENREVAYKSHIDKLQSGLSRPLRPKAESAATPADTAPGGKFNVGVAPVPRKIANAEEYNALPPGPYIDPEGNHRIKKAQ
jgi:hypothetical protein